MLKRQLIFTSALLLSVFLLCGCSNNKETRAAWLATLPSSGIYGSGTDLATALIPDGMAAELPQKLQSLIESARLFISTITYYYFFKKYIINKRA